MAETTDEMVDRLRGQTCLQFARTTKMEKLPTLLRRVASDLSKLPSYTLVDITVETSYILDEATVSVYFVFDDDG